MAFIASELFITSSWFLFKASQCDRVKRAAIIEKHTLLEIQTFFPSLLIQVWRKARAWGFNRDLSWLLPALGCVHWRWLRCSLGTTLWVPPHTYTHTHCLDSFPQTPSLKTKSSLSERPHADSVMWVFRTEHNVNYLLGYSQLKTQTLAIFSM